MLPIPRHFLKIFAAFDSENIPHVWRLSAFTAAGKGRAGLLLKLHKDLIIAIVRRLNPMAES